MKKILSSVLVASFLSLSTLTPAFAGHRHHGYHHRPYHHFNYHKHYSHHHNYDDDYFWVGLGVGLLTGVLVHAITSPPPPPRTVVYTSPPPVVVRTRPQVVYYENYPPPQPRPKPVLRQVITTTDLLNVRFGPDLQSSVVTQLRHGTIVGVIGAAPGWLYIRTNSGQCGWIMMRYTRNTHYSGAG